MTNPLESIDLVIQLDNIEFTTLYLDVLEDIPAETDFNEAVINTAGDLDLSSRALSLLTPPIYKNSIQASLNNLKKLEPYIDLTGQIKLGVYNTNTHLTLNLSVPFSYLRRAF